MEESTNHDSETLEPERSIVFSRLARIVRIDRSSWRFTLLTAVIITLRSILYVQSVLASWGIYGFSFDDSWIHVQYARTIFEGRPWQYA